MYTIAFFGMPGGSEVILILFIVLLLFGAKKLPELSRALGKSLSEFKKGKEDLEKEIRDMQNDVPDPIIEVEPVKEKTTESEEASDSTEEVKTPESDD